MPLSPIRISPEGAMMNEFFIDVSVRDYECDIQGIVNNSVYMNYLEHARHQFIKTMGIDFAALHLQGIDPVVAKAEMNFRSSLRPGETMRIFTSMQKEGRFRYLFVQKIVRLPGNELVMDAVITAAIVKAGRPVSLEEFDRICQEAGKE
jgi:acyl-CoA thioester hydrolase